MNITDATPVTLDRTRALPGYEFLTDEQTFVHPHLGVAIPYTTVREEDFLGASTLDPTVTGIARVIPRSGKIDRRAASVVFPAFFVMRDEYPQLVIVLNRRHRTNRMKRKLKKFETMAMQAGWCLTITWPHSPGEDSWKLSPDDEHITHAQFLIL